MDRGGPDSAPSLPGNKLVTLRSEPLCTRLRCFIFVTVTMFHFYDQGREGCRTLAIWTQGSRVSLI